MAQTKLILLFDGRCPLLCKEISFLRSSDSSKLISFVDIDSSSYNPEFFKGISFIEAMGRIHAISSAEELLRDVRVFQEVISISWAGLGLCSNYLAIISSTF